MEGAEVLRGTGGDEGFGTGGCPHGDFLPGLTEGGELLVIVHLSERFELPAVDPPTGIVVLTLVSQFARVEAPDVL